jgi:hypothetical protein
MLYAEKMHLPFGEAQREGERWIIQTKLNSQRSVLVVNMRQWDDEGQVYRKRFVAPRKISEGGAEYVLEQGVYIIFDILLRNEEVWARFFYFNTWRDTPICYEILIIRRKRLTPLWFEKFVRIVKKGETDIIFEEGDVEKLIDFSKFLEMILNLL